MESFTSFASGVMDAIKGYNSAQTDETYGIIELVIGLLAGIYSIYESLTSAE